MPNYARGAYTDTSSRSPISLGAAIAINGAVIGALMLANPDVVEQQFKVFRAIPILAEPPPPPPKSIPPKRQSDPVERQAQSQPDIATRTDAPVDTGQPYFPPLPPQPNPGGEEIGRTIESPPHKPVFVGPQINPRYRDALQPTYPPGMIRAEKEGVVVIRVLIGTDGRVKDVQKVEAAEEAFYRATAEQALKRWRFLPATEDGAAKESWKVMTIRFRLDQL